MNEKETRYSLFQREFENKKSLHDDLCINCIGSTYLANIERTTTQFRYDYYLLYIQDGSLQMKTHLFDVTMSKGDMLIIPPHTKSVLHLSKGEHVDYMWIHFTGNQVSVLLDKVDIKENTVYQIGTHSLFINEWKKIYNEIVIRDSFLDEFCSNSLKYILTSFSRYIHKVLMPAKLKSIIYIHNNLHTDLKISELARIEGFSENRYRDIFMKTVGRSPIDYIINKRIEIAKDLLSNSNESITQISKKIGYDDAYYFSRLFKKKVGLSPNQYRKSTGLSRI